MIESGSIVSLSNNKKYMITDSTYENGILYYLTLEVDYNTEMPKDESVFFIYEGDLKNGGKQITHC